MCHGADEPRWLITEQEFTNLRADTVRANHDVGMNVFAIPKAEQR